VNNALQMGEKIRKRREKLRLSRRQVAKAAGVVDKTIYNFETGNNTPTFDTALVIMRVLGLAVVELEDVKEGREPY
jgi:DNA-binding XRE family transcriptional regulator